MRLSAHRPSTAFFICWLAATLPLAILPAMASERTIKDFQVLEDVEPFPDEVPLIQAALRAPDDVAATQDLAQFRKNTGRTLLASALLGGQFERSERLLLGIAYLESAGRLQHNDAETWVLLAEALTMLGTTTAANSAIPFATKALNLKPEPSLRARASLAQAKAYTSLGRTLEAKEKFKALADDPAVFDAADLDAYVRTYLVGFDILDGGEFLEKAAMAYPENPYLAIGSASLLRVAGEPERALAVLAHSLEQGRHSSSLIDAMRGLSARISLEAALP